MSAPKFTTYPGIGETAAQNLRYSQAVRVGDRVYTSGQGGWDTTVADRVAIRPTLEQEFEQAFQNVELALRSAGSKNGWRDVYKVVSYHANWKLSGECQQSFGGTAEGPEPFMIANLKKFCGPDHRPTWTEVGVTRLGDEKMNVEIEVEAYVGE